jgi:hypothetical protein
MMAIKLERSLNSAPPHLDSMMLQGARTIVTDPFCEGREKKKTILGQIFIYVLAATPTTFTKMHIKTVYLVSRIRNSFFS